MQVVYLLFLLLVLPKGTTALSVARTAIWNQCSSSCASIGVQKSQEKKYAKPTITFCQLWENQASVIDPAIELGLRTLKRDFGNTVEFEWVKNILPGGCNDETFLHSSPSAVDLQMIKSVNGCSVFMGPGCSGAIEQIRGLINHWNVPLVTTEGSSISQNQMIGSKLITRLGFTQEAVVLFITKLLKFFNWTNIAVIYDNDSSSTGFGKALEDFMLQDQNLGLRNLDLGSRILPLLNHDDYRPILGRANASARVIILAALSNITRDIMLTAADLGMTNGDYVFITADLFYVSGQAGSLSWQTNVGILPERKATGNFSDRQTDRDRFESFQKAGDILSRDIKTAFQSLFVVQLKMPDNAEYLRYQQELKDLSASKYNFVYADNHKVGPYDDHSSYVSHLVMGFFDACRVYGLVLNDTLMGGEDPFDGLAMTKKMWNKTFHGIGTEIVLSPKGDRVFDFYLLGFDVVTNEFSPVMKFMAANNSLQNVKTVSWPKNKRWPPPNIPPCGFDGKSGPCREQSQVRISANSTIIIILVALVVTGGVVGLVVSLTKYKAQSDLNDEWWQVSWSDIVFAKKGHSSDNSLLNPKNLPTKKVTESHTVPSIQSSGVSGGPTMRSRMYIENGIYKDTPVAVKRLPNAVVISRENMVELRNLRNLIHDHILRLVGLCLEPANECLLYEYCQKGSLRDLLEKESLALDWTLRFSIIHEMVEGMVFLHSSAFKSHGRFKSNNLLIHGRLVVKIGDTGLWNMHNQYPVFIDPESTEAEVKPLLWVAPEHLRPAIPLHGTPKGDVYSFGIVLSELILRTEPYEEQYLNMDTKAIIKEVRKGSLPAFRPLVPADSCEPGLHRIMNDCWVEDPVQRPTFEQLRVKLLPLVKQHTGNFFNNIIKRMEKYAIDLETAVNERTAAFAEEKKKCEELLNQILPRMVAEKLLQGGHIDPESFASVTIYFSDIVGFTSLSSTSTAVEVVDLLNDLYTVFDSIIEDFDAYKVETIGDAYMVASGLPVRNENRHAYELGKMSIKILKSLRRVRVRHRPGAHLQLRIGLHTGPCAAGVVGLKMPRYCLFGDTVITAHRMESTSEAMKIHISSSTYALLRDYPDMVTQPRGEIEIANLGIVRTYWLNGGTE